jgi:tetraacyldisaccharide 4'-kinase
MNKSGKSRFDAFEGKASDLLMPLSAAYGLVTSFRNFLFDRDWLSVKKLKAPVISIGNLTVGGTGKTPLVEYLAAMLLGAGKKPAILIRGYGGRNRGTIMLGAGDRHGLDAPDLVGDEALMLHARLAGVPVIVDRERHRGGTAAENLFPVDVFILDDGMQHRRLHRDIELVVIDALNPFSNGRLLPAGPLREPPGGLRRADAVVLTRSKRRAPDRLPEAALKVLGRDRPVFHAYHEITGFSRLDGQDRLPDLKEAGMIAFAGIGRPALFFEDLRSAGCRILETHAFPDHYRYRASDITFLAERVRSKQAVGLVTTEKDAQRLKGLPFGAIPVYYMSIRALIREEKTFSDFLLSRLKGHPGWA